MKRWIVWTTGAALTLGLLAAATATSGLYMAEQRRERTIDIKARPVAYTTDATTVERGRYLFASRGCADCHGASGTGRVFLDDGKGTRIVGPNITPAGVVARYQPEDWNSVIRHGVKPNGKPVLIMPSEDYNRWTQEDLNALVSYVRQFPPQQGLDAQVQLPRAAWVLYGLGAIPDAASRIDHTRTPPRPVPEGVTVEHGRYVAQMCIGCHGAQLQGGRIPGGPPDWPAAARLQPGEGSGMARYADAQSFVAMLRTGQRPDGTPIKVMPFEALRAVNDVDAQALYTYLRSLPAEGSAQP